MVAASGASHSDDTDFDIWMSLMNANIEKGEKEVPEQQALDVGDETVDIQASDKSRVVVENKHVINE